MMTYGRRALLVFTGLAVVLASLTGYAQQVSPGPGSTSGVAQTGAREVAAWVTIPAGTFEMGCVQGDGACDRDERPRHTVTISRPFRLMTTEVTLGQFRALGVKLHKQQSWNVEDMQPAVNVTREEAFTFCLRAGGRLPTEAEWEYAARGGQGGSIFPWGDEGGRSHANYGKEKCCGGLADGADQWEYTAPVGSFPANGYGLFDMAGNVREWVSDGFDSYRAAPVQDPSGRPTAQYGIFRGGSFYVDLAALRLSERAGVPLNFRTDDVGFRCARNAEP